MHPRLRTTVLSESRWSPDLTGHLNIDDLSILPLRSRFKIPTAHESSRCLKASPNVVCEGRLWGGAFCAIPWCLWPHRTKLRKMLETPRGTFQPYLQTVLLTGKSFPWLIRLVFPLSVKNVFQTCSWLFLQEFPLMLRFDWHFEMAAFHEKLLTCRIQLWY